MSKHANQNPGYMTVAPKVSICIPAYNQTTYLTKTITTILSQTYSDFEIVISDDSSDNRVIELLGKFDFGGKLRYFKNPAPLGSPDNWNCCVGKANGQYVKIMHHDDWFTSPDSLQSFVEKMEESNAALVFSDAEIFYEKRKDTGFHSPGKDNVRRLKQNHHVLFRHNFIGAPSMIMFRRDPVLIFDKNLKWVVDFDFYIRYLTKHKGVAHIGRPLIGILADSENTVTAECINNKSIEIFENMYLFDKLRNSFNLVQLLKNCSYLFKILRRFQISRLKEITHTGLSKPLPAYFHLLFRMDKMYHHLIGSARKAARGIITSFKA